MTRVPVISTNLDSVGHDEESTTLEVAFKNGSVWQYEDVPRSVYEGILSAPSPGGFFSSHVKGQYNGSPK